MTGSLTTLVRVAIASLLFSFASAAMAQEMPDLVGTWTSKYRAAVHDEGKFEIGEETTAIVIEKQDGEFFQGAAVWEMNEDYTGSSDIGEEDAVGGNEVFIGMIGLDGQEITMAEVEDTGLYRGRILDENRLMLTYMESDVGDAVLLRAIFTRQQP